MTKSGVFITIFVHKEHTPNRFKTTIAYHKGSKPQEPTTQEPTTQEPTTQEPTTQEPTTQKLQQIIAKYQ